MAKTEPSLQTSSELWPSIHWAVLIQSQGTSQIARIRVRSVLFGGKSNPLGPMRVRLRLTPIFRSASRQASPQAPKRRHRWVPALIRGEVRLDLVPAGDDPGLPAPAVCAASRRATLRLVTRIRAIRERSPLTAMR